VSQGSSGVNWSASLEALAPVILHLFGPSAVEGTGWDMPYLSPGGKGIFPSSEYTEEALDVSPGGVMGLKDSPNQIQEPLWIFSQSLTMTFAVIPIKS
ncbi:hypothetical protein DBR06_SOUSAS10610029, partial [Sousa chinensis]